MEIIVKLYILLAFIFASHLAMAATTGDYVDMAIDGAKKPLVATADFAQQEYDLAMIASDNDLLDVYGSILYKKFLLGTIMANKWGNDLIGIESQSEAGDIVLGVMEYKAIQRIEEIMQKGLDHLTPKDMDFFSRFEPLINEKNDLGKKTMHDMRQISIAESEIKAEQKKPTPNKNRIATLQSDIDAKSKKIESYIKREKEIKKSIKKLVTIPAQASRVAKRAWKPIHSSLKGGLWFSRIGVSYLVIGLGTVKKAVMRFNEDLTPEEAIKFLSDEIETMERVLTSEAQ